VTVNYGNYYVESVPGDNSRADAVNLLLASLDGNDLFPETIVDRQPEGCLIPILGSMTAMFMILLMSVHPDDREHIVGHFREHATGDGPIPRQGLVRKAARAQARAGRQPVMA
jgi:hypothetical protein